MLPSQLLPYKPGVNEELERKADQIIVVCAENQQTPWKESDLLGPGRLETGLGARTKTRMILYEPHIWTGESERTGIYIRDANVVRYWLNSQPLMLGGRIDLIRHSGEPITTREHYERWGTMQNGRNDPWMAAMTMTVKKEEARWYQRHRAKLRAGEYNAPPWKKR